MNAIITGATKGIGKAIATMLASKGINIAACARNEEDLVAFKKQLTELYPSVKIIVQTTDVSQPSEVTEFFNYIISEFETIDILINNAGLFIPGSILKENEGTLEKMVETNLYSAYRLTRHVAPLMISNGHGHIFNMCSIASITAYNNGGSYSISKYAMYGFNKNLREELKDYNIKVTAILPGATWSASWEGVDLPENRLMQADDIAKLVWTALEMSESATIEDIVIRPQLGDL